MAVNGCCLRVKVSANTAGSLFCRLFGVWSDAPGKTHPPEYADAHGVLALRFSAHPCSLVGGHPEACVYLLKRERHKIKLEKPHLPPGVFTGATRPHCRSINRAHSCTSSLLASLSCRGASKLPRPAYCVPSLEFVVTKSLVWFWSQSLVQAAVECARLLLLVPVPLPAPWRLWHQWVSAVHLAVLALPLTFRGMRSRCAI